MTEKNLPHKAKWWTGKSTGSSVLCRLCPRSCIIRNNKTGFCGIRKNIDGTLYTMAYGYPVGLQIDPIEKKPLYHFLPGTATFSLGTYGCNLNCSFCQNYHLSRGSYSTTVGEKFYSPQEIAELALRYNCRSVAFTYNEPLIWPEYMTDIAQAAKKLGLSAVLVSNAYIQSEAAEEILPHIDAANFDMKGFSEDFYKTMTGGDLKPVLDTIRYFYSTGRHLELTNLVIPGKNDSEKMITDYLNWVKSNLSTEVPLHFSAFHPDYLLQDIPNTPVETLKKIKKQATAMGFTNVHLGNVRLI